MEFEGQYLTYEEYKGLGGTLNLTPFNLLEFEARKQIDLRTQKRLVELNEIPNEVKLCMFHLIERIKSYDKSVEDANNSNGSVTSESIDGYSVSYNQINAAQIKEIINSKNVELDNVIMNDLYGLIVNNEHVIYNGVN